MCVCVCVGRFKSKCDAPGSELDAEPLRSRPYGSHPSGLLCSKEDSALPPNLCPRLQALRPLVEEVACQSKHTIGLPIQRLRSEKLTRKQAGPERA